MDTVKKFIACNEFRQLDCNSQDLHFDFVSVDDNVPSHADISVGQVDPISLVEVSEKIIKDYIRLANKQVRSHLKQIAVPFTEKEKEIRRGYRRQIAEELRASTGQEPTRSAVNAVMHLRHPRPYNFSTEVLVERGFDFVDAAAEEALRRVEHDPDASVKAFAAQFSGRQLAVLNYLILKGDGANVWGWKHRVAAEWHVHPAKISADIAMIREAYLKWLEEN